jgi:hypothetical protein
VRWLVQVNKVVLDSVREGIALFGPQRARDRLQSAVERIAEETIGTLGRRHDRPRPGGDRALTRARPGVSRPGSES